MDEQDAINIVLAVINRCGLPFVMAVVLACMVQADHEAGIAGLRDETK